MTTSLDSILSGADAAASADANVANATASEPIAASPARPQAEQAERHSPDPEAQGAANEPASVPVAALREERDKGRKRYTEAVESFERKLAEQNAAWEWRMEQLVGALRANQPPQNAPPDFFADPDQAVDRRIAAALQPMAASQQQLMERMSQRFALQNHGADTVQAAYDALEARIAQDPRAALADYQRIMASADPWSELVNWHGKESVLREIGDDPAAYRARLKAELMEELGGASAPLHGGARDARRAPLLPSNLAGARNAGTRHGPAWGGPAPLQDIFDRAQRKTRSA
jgi:hypothetical protein